jgi:gamma-glutamyltranspeptidase/glutathione hydrolase
VIDRDGNIVSLIQSLYSSFGSGVVAPGTGVMLHNRGGLFTMEDGHPNQIAPRKRPLHTIIPAFMEKGDVKIGFGIMGGFNQAQAHAQFVSTSLISVSTSRKRSRPDGSTRIPSTAAT